MKISTRLGLSAFFPAIMTLTIIVVLVFSSLVMGKIQQNGDTVRQIRSDITELNHIVFSYILYHEERPKQQFVAGHDKLMQLLAVAQVQGTDQQHLLDNIRDDSVMIKDLFLQLVSNFESKGTAGPQELQAKEDRLVGLLLLRSYEADTDAATLRSLIDNGISVNETRTIGLVVLVMVLATIPLTILLVRTRNGIISSISSLGKGAAIIGSGNLDYKIEEKTNDEIGDLSHSFNQMTKSLKTITATKTELEKEIEQRKEAEEALKRYASDLEIANKEIETFSYSVSHDLRSPLRTLDGFSEMVITEYGDRLDETGKDYLKRVRKASQTMSGLVDDILKLSRVSRAELHLEKVNLSDQAKSIAGELQTSQPDRQAEFIINPELTAMGDKNLLEIGLRNLLENAWKYSSKCPHTRIEFGGLNQKGEQVYFIKDSGVGFDTKYADKLFQPFHRFHNDKEYSGTGIGLATVQRIIHRHNGRIWAESEVGKGSTFYFTLG